MVPFLAESEGSGVPFGVLLTVAVVLFIICCIVWVVRR
jgi:hypothetical protein